MPRGDARLSLFVPGTPAPQGSKVAMLSRSTGRPMMMETKACRGNLNAWRAAVAWNAQQAMNGNPLKYEGAVHLVCTFTFIRPKSHLTTKGALRKGKPFGKTTKPDLSKLIRAVEDALTDAGVWRDDSQVVEYAVSKRFGDIEGAQITVCDWEPGE